MSRAAPTGVVTFLFTDIEGSTPLWDAHPDAMRTALPRHDEIVRGAIEDAGGVVFATGGDGFAAAFDGAGSAIEAAVAAQHALSCEPWPEDVALTVRVGLHTGEADERDGDYFGPTVNRAARLMGAANGGQVVVSAATASLVDTGALGVELVDLGTIRLKGMVQPVAVLGVDAPLAPWVDRPLTAFQTSSGNLPRPRTEFVGSLTDLQGRIDALDDRRLVTLTGAGGIGKTRTAIEVGWLLLDEYTDGAWLVELGPVTDPDLVVAAVATTLGVQPQRGRSLTESIVDWCQGRRVLLILDNCEHVLEPATELVAALGATGARVTLIATSREPLGVPGEQVVRVPSLAPTTSTELFRERAVAAGGTLDGSEDEHEAITDICARLDGIPLAIELAAARTRSLSPRELLGRLDDRFRLLRGAGRGGIERQQTLRATVSWSYQLLSEDQQRLFDRLSVFAGGFDLDAAEAVGADDLLDEIEIVDLLVELVDKSMVVADRSHQATRYRLLETLRQYGEERLDDRGETAAVRDRHLAHFRRRSEEYGLRWLSPDQLDVDAAIDREWDNLRTAHGWAVATEAFEPAVVICAGSHLHATGNARLEAAAWTDSTLALGDRIGAEDAGLYGRVAQWANMLSQPGRSLDLSTRAVAAARDDGRELVRAAVHGIYLFTLNWAGQDASEARAEARAMLTWVTDEWARWSLLMSLLNVPNDEPVDIAELDELAAVTRSIGAPALIAEAQRLRASAMLNQASTPADALAAMEAHEEAIASCRQARAPLTECWTRGGLAFAATVAGHPDAVALTREALAFADAHHYPGIIDAAMTAVSMTLAAEGDPESAATLVGFAEQRDLSPFFIEVRDGVDAQLPQGTPIDEARRRGAAMTRPEAVAFADAALAGRDARREPAG